VVSYLILYIIKGENKGPFKL